jgi:hypothetical protein
MQVRLKATKFVKGAWEILGYPLSTSSKSTSSRVGLRSLEVGWDDTNLTSFSTPWYKAILEMLHLNQHTIYFNTLIILETNIHCIQPISKCKKFDKRESNSNRFPERNPNHFPKTKLTQFEIRKKTKCHNTSGIALCKGSKIRKRRMSQ